MRALTADGIDLSEELPPKIVKSYTDSRKKRGELEYNNGSILIRFPHPVDRLTAPRDDSIPGTGILDEHQRYSAVEIMLLQEVALKKLDIASLREFSHWFDWGEGPKHPETVYIRVMRRLPRAEAAMIERICFHRVRDSDYRWIENQAAFIRTAFTTLGKTIAEVRHVLRDTLEAEEGQSFDQICAERFAAYKMRLQLERKPIARKPKPV